MGLLFHGPQEEGLPEYGNPPGGSFFPPGGDWAAWERFINCLRNWQMQLEMNPFSKSNLAAGPPCDLFETGKPPFVISGFDDIVHGGSGGSGGTSAPCIPLDLPADWGRCRADKNPLPGFTSWTWDPYSEEELLEKCGSGPCVRSSDIPDQDDWAYAEENYYNSSLDGDPALADIIACAWALLSDNLPLIDWLECVVTGGELGGGCLEDSILGNTSIANPFGRMKVVDVYKPESGFNFTYLFGVVTANEALLQGYINAWNNSPDEHACVCASVAGILLHELWHNCNNTLGDAPFPFPCSKAQQMEHGFTFAVAQWYPDIMKGSGCSSYSDPDWWLSANNTDMFNGVP